MRFYYDDKIAHVDKDLKMSFMSKKVFDKQDESKFLNTLKGVEVDSYKKLFNIIERNTY